MSPSVHTRSPARRHSSDWSESPPKRRSSARSRSPHKRGSPRRDRSPDRRRGSPPRMKSPTRSKSSHKARSPTREALSSRGHSPNHAKHPLKSISLSPSPSPRTKRLRRAQAERDAERTMERDRDRTSSRDKDRERHKRQASDKDMGYEKRTADDKHDGHSSRRKHEHSSSPGERSRKLSNHGHHSPRRVESSQERKHAAKTGARDEEPNAKGSLPTRDEEHDSVSKMKVAEEALETKQKQKPSFELSGKLSEETNRVKGVTLLFTEPPDARKPDMRWRLYVFKAGEVLNEPLYVHRQSCYLFGRERRVADVPTDHPSCSKQHAVIQFRLVEKEGADGLMKKQVMPYLMDLGSTNGTFINDNQIEPQRYYELFEKDTIRFGNSSREYVLLHENSAT
ncbi:FHA domain-containing protein DDL [Nymphaea colorata]|nr:FHA domain-containing protein DDL [Nymphaea colorata]